MISEYAEKIPSEVLRYLVFYGPNDDQTGIRGIRADAPPDAIEAYVDWYRRNNRYENGRLRPKNIVRKSLVVSV